MSLLTVTQDFEDLSKLADQLLETEGEIPASLELLLADTLTKQAEMVNRYCQFLDHTERQIEAVKAEIKIAQEWIENQSKRQKRFEEFVLRILQHRGLRTLDGLYGHKFSLRHSESVEITDQGKIPDTFLNTHVVQTPDKTAIKNALRQGREVPGCAIKSKDNLNWK